jgi:hypothetical protein
LATGIQEEIIDWLHTVRENIAATWYEWYWSGNRGNYTNASASYSGNNAQGIEFL